MINAGGGGWPAANLESRSLLVQDNLSLCPDGGQTAAAPAFRDAATPRLPTSEKRRHN